MIIMEELSKEVIAESPAELDATPSQAESKRPKARPKRKATKRPSSKIIITSKSKRKRSVARASAKQGSGTIRVNGVLVDAMGSDELRFSMLKGVYISDTTREIARGLDINVNVHGGGVSSQAQAVASAISRIIAEKGGDPVKDMLLHYERRLIKDDHRRVEPKKFLGPKARARFQTSYR